MGKGRFTAVRVEEDVQAVVIAAALLALCFACSRLQACLCQPRTRSRAPRRPWGALLTQGCSVVAQAVHEAALGSTAPRPHLCSSVHFYHSDFLIPTKMLLRLMAGE